MKARHAERLAKFEHGARGQMYGGREYEYHLSEVCKQVRFLYGESPKLDLILQVAWLHDIKEDCGYTDEMLLEEGFVEEVVFAVACISKRPNESLEDYYDRVALSSLAMKVKIADTLSNLMHSLRERNTKRINKYTQQLQQLERRRSKIKE